MTPLDCGYAAASGTGAPKGCLADYQRIRSRSVELARPLSAEDQAAQSMPDASPVKWHLAHTTWFFETFLLKRLAAGYVPFDPIFDYLFNSYYEAVGPRQPRPQRGLLTRPDAAQVAAYRRHVDAAMEPLLRDDLTGEALDFLQLGLAHEQQHQELMLMDVLHLFAQSPLHPAYSQAAPLAPMVQGADVFHRFDGGLVEIGDAGAGFAFDNEGPRHKVYVAPFTLCERLVTNRDWLRFMADGGYDQPRFWLADGWDRVQAEGWRAPFYWRQGAEGWLSMTLRGLRPIDGSAPVAHVSFYEAAAFAAWADARLPTEAEWEVAATSNARLDLMDGAVWQWTASAYGPYPGFKPRQDAVGEYNGKFMSGQMVLRGGCLATPDGHARPTYRNFYHPHQRWMFSGLRLARDVQDGAGMDKQFAADATAGLSAQAKSLSPKYFYDEAGSQLFEAICQTPEYYPTRTETALLRQIAPQLVRLTPADACLVEFGSGASVKTRILLDAKADLFAYAPIDISPSALQAAADAISRDYPGLVVAPLAEDFTDALNLPPAVRGHANIGFFPGSTIGNFPPAQAVRFLRSAKDLLGAGARFIVGVDLVKDEATLVRAYDDAGGVTRAFNKNLLARMNRELDADFDLDAFDHLARWNAAESCMEMHLVSRRDQTVHVAGKAHHFAMGETLHTESSYKYTSDSFRALAAQGGWTVAQSWISPAPQFAVFLLQA